MYERDYPIYKRVRPPIHQYRTIVSNELDFEMYTELYEGLRIKVNMLVYPLLHRTIYRTIHKDKQFSSEACALVETMI